MTDRSTGSGPADYLAAERTFLAWIRTGLSLMGFGFVVARFGLFLQTLLIGQPNLPFRPVGISPWFGTALIVLGVIVNLVSAWNHIRLVRELKHGGAVRNRPSSLAISVALLLAVLGVAMAIYFVSFREPLRAGAGNAVEKLIVIGHGGEAEKAGMRLRPAKLIVGNPETGAQQFSFTEEKQ
jgi:putative membrane protein